MKISLIKFYSYCLLPYWIYFLLYRIADYGLTTHLEDLLRSSQGISNAELLFWGTLTITLALAAPLFLQVAGAFLASKAFSEPRAQSWPSILNFSLIEGLRAMGSVLRWSLLFVLPGIYKFLTFAFVPWVVFFSKPYHEGKVDALKESKSIFRKYALIITLLFLGGSLLWPLLESFLGVERTSLLEGPSPYLGFSAIDALLHGLITFCLSRIYFQELKAVSQEQG